MDPVSIGIAGLAASVVGAGVGAVGAISSANAQASQANYAAQVAANNQLVASQNAAYASKAGEAAAAAEGAKNRAAYGALVAGQGASGVDVNSGSAVDVRETQRETGLLDVQTVRQNAALTSYGYRTQATNFGAEAGLESAKASQAPIAGALGATASLLGGAGSVASKYGFMLNNPNANPQQSPWTSD